MRYVASGLRSTAILVVLTLLVAALPDGLQAQYFRYGKNKVQYDAQEWSYLQSKHFDVYYYEGGYHLANFTAKAAEDAYRQVRDGLDAFLLFLNIQPDDREVGDQRQRRDEPAEVAGAFRDFGDDDDEYGGDEDF